MADRIVWEESTCQQQLLAMAAEAELRRRHPRPSRTAALLRRPQPARPGQHNEPELASVRSR
jgi:hypothetical protein